MGLYLNPGKERFSTALNSQIYVDKSELIAFTNSVIGTEQRFVCVSRPRRFGKSMAANMLIAYYECECDAREMFLPLKIAKDSSFEKYLNQYDVIYLNIQHFMYDIENLENVGKEIQRLLLLDLKSRYGNYILEGDINISSALTKIYKETHGEKGGFIFIVDEWDCLFREAKNNQTAHKAYLDFLKNLFKDQIYVKLVYMTGILPIKKYGSHSALNIFDEYSMADPSPLEQFVGFTEDEVKKLCDNYKMNFEELKRWYDGYRFPNAPHIYNPKSVVSAMMKKRVKSYWTRTETYEALKIYIDMNFDGLKEDIVSLLGDEKRKINISKFENDMTTFHSKDDILTLLVHLGYLAYDNQREKAYIPNFEVREEFVNAMDGNRWSEVINALQRSDDLLESTWQMDAATV